MNNNSRKTKPTIDPALYAPVWVTGDLLPKDKFNEILPGLYMGGTDDDDVVFRPARRSFDTDPGHFDAVATLYAYAQPVTWGVEEMRLGIGDSPLDPRFIDAVMRMATWVHQRWSAGDHVLVRCQAGMNRSGLVTALALMIEGRTALEAIALIRAQRSPVCLFNNAFVDWLVTEAPARVSKLQPQSPSKSPSAA